MIPGRYPLLRHCRGDARSRYAAPQPPQSAGSSWPLHHPSHECLPGEGWMQPSQGSADSCPTPWPRPSYRGQHVQNGVYVPPLVGSKPRGHGSSVLLLFLSRPHPLTPNHMSPTSLQPTECLRHNQPEDQGGRTPERPAAPASWLSHWSYSPGPGSAPGPAWREKGICADGRAYPVLASLFPGAHSFSSYSRCSELV